VTGVQTCALPILVMDGWTDGRTSIAVVYQRTGHELPHTKTYYRAYNDGQTETPGDAQVTWRDTVRHADFDTDPTQTCKTQSFIKEIAIKCQFVAVL